MKVSTNKVFTVSKTVITDMTAVEKEITFLLEDKEKKYIYVKIQYNDSESVPIATEEFRIEGSNYEMLMSESPDFAVGKPMNEYRESDLWYIIGYIINR